MDLSPQSGIGKLSYQAIVDYAPLRNLRISKKKVFREFRYNRELL
jgi:hypothetical protein